MHQGQDSFKDSKQKKQALATEKGLQKKSMHNSFMNKFSRGKSICMATSRRNHKHIKLTILPRALFRLNPCSKRCKRDGGKHHQGNFCWMIDAQNMDQKKRCQGGKKA